MKQISLIMIFLLVVGLAAGCASVSGTSTVEAAEAQAQTVTGDGEDYGAIGAMAGQDWTIEEMLKYAIEDEYLARQEYAMIMDAYGEQKPFSNIIKAEETHIAMLKDIYAEYDYDMPEDLAAQYAILPDSVDEALALGVMAEENNIAMYEMFLEKDLPDDIKDVFTELRDASVNHLAAFKKGPRGSGNGNQ